MQPLTCDNARQARGWQETSGPVSRAWAAYTGREPSYPAAAVYASCKARADASSPAASDGSYPSSRASGDGYALLPLEFAP
jgi:hypothetical protein